VAALRDIFLKNFDKYKKYFKMKLLFLSSICIQETYVVSVLHEND
jgi:hypothetical protein